MYERGLDTIHDLHTSFPDLHGRGMGPRRASLVMTIEKSKVKFMEKIGVKSKQMRRRSVGGLNLREKSASYPNCHSIRNDASIIEIDIESKLGDLTLLLHDETSRKLFRNFLKKEHSEENLDFWMAVDSYRSRDIIRAKYIYSKFLAPGALCEVNIEDRIRKNIRRKITSGTATIDLFDDAKNAVFILIKRDSYKRFKQQYSTSASLETLKTR